MSIGYTILIITGLVLLFVIGELLHIIEEKDKEWEKYYRSLRRAYEISIDELKKDIEVRDELLKAYTYNKFRGDN